MKQLYYIANYPSYKEGHYRYANRAAALQSEYLAQALSEIGYEVTIVSTATSDARGNILSLDRGFEQRSDNYKSLYFGCINSRIIIFRVLGRFFFNCEIKRFINKHNGIYIVYHSKLHYKINRWIKKIRGRFILEVEEIYGDVTQDKFEREKEIKETGFADAYIIPNSMMCPEVTRDKKWVLYHGTCKKEPRLENIFNDDKIHIVYAGTMDPRKVGVMPSLDAALYLDTDKYHIHVLAVGYPENQEKIKERVAKLPEPHCQISFHDPLDGDDYLKFIQSCEIGLYTQGVDDIDKDTSFPSKLMSYLSNGLRIVATKTKPLELSEISDVIYFSDSNSGKDIAKAILGINYEDGYDGRRKASEIHERLKKDLQELLKDF